MFYVVNKMFFIFNSFKNILKIVNILVFEKKNLKIL